jgi:hypothetical protein
MTKNTIKINIYEENENNFFKQYTFLLENKIIDVKNKILVDLFDNKFNYLDIKNISEREYKDFGKLSFNIGLLPNTIDNYKLSEFTIENRTFSFLVIPKQIDIKVNKKVNQLTNSVLNKIIKENSNVENKNEFILNNDDFPKLGK